MHFFEKHRNQQVSLKLGYSCMCKSNDSSIDNTFEKETNSDSNGTLSKNDKDCFHSSWKSCHSHIISIIHRILANMKCLKCNKLVPNDKYQLHLKTEHQIEKLVVCPLCGVLDK